jgi:type IV fimbrial biogenesis protein FimT
MDRKGFSLVELLVIVCIISILLGIATINFNHWVRRYNIEKEVKEIYAELMLARQQSFVTGMNHRVEFESANSIVFRRYSSEWDLDHGSGVVVRQRILPYSITISDPNDKTIEFNPRGMMNDIIPKSVCIYSGVTPPIDSIYITQTRINVGKIKNQGNSCEKANISIN